jgi:hypothetical protein
MDVDMYKTQIEYNKKHKEEFRLYQRAYWRECKQKLRKAHRELFNSISLTLEEFKKKKQQPPTQEKYKERIKVYF